jgi:hypothetical protein
MPDETKRHKREIFPFDVFCPVLRLRRGVDLSAGPRNKSVLRKVAFCKLQSHDEGVHEFQEIRGQTCDPFGNLVSFGIFRQ